MNWLNLHIASTIRAPEFIGCCPTDRATWLCLMGYCSEQENGGIIKDCQEWGERRWLQTCGITKVEVSSVCALWAWTPEGIKVWGYCIDKELEVRAKREAGLNRWKDKNKERKYKGKEGHGKVSANSSAISSAIAELQVPMNLDTTDFKKTWEEWIRFRITLKKVKDWKSMFQGQLNWLSAMTLEAAIQVLNQSIRNGWQGLFELKGNHEQLNNGRGNRQNHHNAGLATNPTELGKRAAALARSPKPVSNGVATKMAQVGLPLPEDSGTGQHG